MTDTTIRDKTPTRPAPAPVAKPKGPIGSRVERKEDARFLTGAGQYTDDVVQPHQTYAYFLRSPHAHDVPCKDGPLGLFRPRGPVE